MSDTLTVHRANGDAYRLVGKYLTSRSGTVEISSRPESLHEIVTTVSWRGKISVENVLLGMAITELPGYLRATNDDQSITFYRST